MGNGVPTFEDINGRLELQDLPNLIQENECTIRIERHGLQALRSQLMGDRSALYACNC